EFSKRYVDAIYETRRKLTEQYFNSAQSPPLLLVYANFGGDPFIDPSKAPKAPSVPIGPLNAAATRASVPANAPPPNTSDALPGAEPDARANPTKQASPTRRKNSQAGRVLDDIFQGPPQDRAPSTG